MLMSAPCFVAVDFVMARHARDAGFLQTNTRFSEQYSLNVRIVIYPERDLERVLKGLPRIAQGGVSLLYGVYLAVVLSAVLRLLHW
ncbi:hypothetical protein [Azospirillum sp. sgz302134]